jgi:hypothetical protein
MSYLNLHYLEHGSFAASATERVDPVLLEAILRPAVVIAAGQDRVDLRWMGKAGKSYQVFTAPDLSGPWTAGPISDGDGSELSFAETPAEQTRQRFYKVVAW